MLENIQKYLSKLLFPSKNNKFDSKKYWSKRYKDGHTSGSGSYGYLAEFKAEVINNFVKANSISEVIELGCGDGNQLKLAEYPKYIGYDVTREAVRKCKKMFIDDSTKSFFNYKNLNRKHNLKADLVISLEVIFHLIEEEVYHNYMEKLFELSSKYVIIYSSNFNQYIGEHVKCRKFTDWIASNVDDKFQQIDFIENKYPFDPKYPTKTSFSDFYIFKRINSPE